MQHVKNGVKFHGPVRTQQRQPPLSRAELHIHLDGSVRIPTIWELSKAKNLPLPGKGSLGELRAAVEMFHSASLTVFLDGFKHLLPAVVDDMDAIERIAYEFCEDATNAGNLYVEARFSPHLLLKANSFGPGREGAPTSDDVLDAVIRGFERGEKDFGLTVRILLCCIRGLEQFDKDVLRLCEKYRGHWVVGIDTAGDEAGLNEKDELMFGKEVIEIYDEARRLGIHRTVHAGEAGPAKCVEQALDILRADRIGHGYHTLDNPVLYARCLKDDIHFETCPTSSILTGAQPPEVFYHATLKMAEDGANFSINSDDPTVTGTWTGEEYDLVRSWGLNEVHLVRSTTNAIRSSFLPAADKSALLKKLKRVYVLDDEP